MIVSSLPLEAAGPGAWPWAKVSNRPWTGGRGVLSPTFLSPCGSGEGDKLPQAARPREGVLANYLAPIISEAAAVGR